MRKMKKVVSVIAAAAMAASLLAGCGGSGGSSTTAAETKAAETTAAAAETTAAEAAADTTAAPAAAENPVAGKKVAYIMLLPSATIFQMWKDSCASLCDALDVKFDFFFCDGDFNKWQDTIRTCASAGYDGLLVSHGNQDGSYVFLKEITEQYPDMKRLYLAYSHDLTGCLILLPANLAAVKWAVVVRTSPNLNQTDTFSILFNHLVQKNGNQGLILLEHLGNARKLLILSVGVELCVKGNNLHIRILDTLLVALGIALGVGLMYMLYYKVTGGVLL